MAPLPDDRPTAVYRFFDASDRLLYVGITYDIDARWKGHAKKDWWKDVVRKDVIWFEDRAFAQIEESRAIRFEEPIHNRREGASEIGWRTIRVARPERCERFWGSCCAPLDRIDLRRQDTFRRIEHVEIHQAHALVYRDGVPGGVMIPWDWYVEACEAMGDPVDVQALLAAAAKMES